MKASEDLKGEIAKSLGLPEDRGQLTSREAGNMVREMTQLGKQAILDENQKLGLEVAQELGLTEAFLSGRGWRDFTPKQIFAFAERLAQKRKGNP